MPQTSTVPRHHRQIGTARTSHHDPSRGREPPLLFFQFGAIIEKPDVVRGKFRIQFFIKSMIALGVPMKFSVFAVSVFTVFASTFSSSAFATAVSTRVLLDQVELNGVVQRKYVAVVKPNLRTKKLNVEIINDICGSLSSANPGRIRCMATPITVAKYELPYSRSESCGSKIYIAREDKRMVDGALIEITYKDHSRRMCTDLVANLKELSVKVETLRGTPFEYTAYNGKALLEGHAAIYEALIVEEEVLNPGIAGSSRTRKSVGGLVCEKSSVLVPGAQPHYSCVLN